MLYILCIFAAKIGVYCVCAYPILRPQRYEHVRRVQYTRIPLQYFTVSTNPLSIDGRRKLAQSEKAQCVDDGCVSGLWIFQRQAVMMSHLRTWDTCLDMMWHKSQNLFSKISRETIIDRLYLRLDDDVFDTIVHRDDAFLAMNKIITNNNTIRSHTKWNL